MNESSLLRTVQQLEQRIEFLESQDILFEAYEDLRVPMTSFKLGSANDPDFAVWKTDGGGSQGIYTWYFDDSTEEELFFAAQLPHGYNEATDIYPHVHWFPTANGTAGQVVAWGLEYVWANLGATTSANTTIISANTPTPDDDPLVANRHYLTSLDTISGSGKGISSMLVCRLFRDATGALDTDDYAADVGLMEFDFHYHVNSLGSRSELAK